MPIRLFTPYALRLSAQLATLVGFSIFVEAQPDELKQDFPSYGRALLLEESSETSASVSISDINGDGKLDIVLAKGRHWPLVNRVLLGNGKGAFPTARNLSPESERTYSGALVDIDGDGDLDVVASNDKPDINRIYLNDSTGSFKADSTFGETAWPTRYLCIADLNDDGAPDIIVANRRGKRNGSNYICLNDGSGKFASEPIAFAHYSSTTITPADFNQDGLVDLAVPHRDGGQGYLFLQTNKEKIEFAKVPFGPPDASIRMSRAADFDSDGDLDLATIDTARGLSLYFQDANGAFSSKRDFGKPPAMPYALAVSDLDRDGQPDIIVGYRESVSEIHFNQKSGKSFKRTTFGDGQGAVYGFAIADLNKDGIPDIATARSNAPNVVYFGER